MKFSCSYEVLNQDKGLSIMDHRQDCERADGASKGNAQQVEAGQSLRYETICQDPPSYETQQQESLKGAPVLAGVCFVLFLLN